MGGGSLGQCHHLCPSFSCHTQETKRQSTLLPLPRPPCSPSHLNTHPAPTPGHQTKSSQALDSPAVALPPLVGKVKPHTLPVH